MKELYFLAFLLSATPFFSNAQMEFEDVTAPAGLTQMGANYGAAIADFNNDGWDDIFAPRLNEPCQLFQNNGDGTFTNIAPEAGVDFVGTATAVAWADIDNDGWLDLMIGNRDGGNVLYHANGDGTFSNIAEEAGVAEGEKVKAILFSDVDMDGYVDIYIVRFFLENILFKNNGDLTFSDLTDWSNATDNGMSMGALFFDYDNDGDPDLYLTRDGQQTFILYQNLGNGKFVDVSLQSSSNIAAMGMGVDVGDVNNDGWLDIYVTNLYHNSLLINNADDGFFGPAFEEVAEAAGVADVGMGWGISFLDCDNDGWQDIYMANDSYYSPLPNLLYRNNGDNTFETVDSESPVASMEPTYGVAVTDANNDGKMDIFITNSNGDLGNQFFQNTIENENNWVKIKAIGTESNRAAIGTKITMEAGGMVQSDEIISGSSYSSQNSLTIHFGLGDVEVIDKLTLRWPNGMIEEYEQLPVNTTYTMTEGEGYITPVFDIFGKFEINVSPNPFSENIKITFPDFNFKKAEIELIDLLGKKIKSHIFNNSDLKNKELQIETLDLPAGQYFLKVNFDENVKTYKVVKN